MKAATSELTLTIVAIIAIGLVLGFIIFFLGDGGQAQQDIQDKWNDIINQ